MKTTWFPEVIGNAIYLMIRDVACASDEEFLKWNVKNIKRLLGNPFYRGLMALLSPALMVKSTAKRWSTFHQGSTMSHSEAVPVGKRMEVRTDLMFPERLFTRLMLRQHCSTFLTVLELTGAKNPAVIYEDIAKGSVRFIASWEP